MGRSDALVSQENGDPTPVRGDRTTPSPVYHVWERPHFKRRDEVPVLLFRMCSFRRRYLVSSSLALCRCLFHRLYRRHHHPPPHLPEHSLLTTATNCSHSFPTFVPFLFILHFLRFPSSLPSPTSPPPSLTLPSLVRMAAGYSRVYANSEFGGCFAPRNVFSRIHGFERFGDVACAL